MKHYSTDDLEISVVIPCYNVEKTIIQQLRALELQNNAPVFEVIISNNNCTDNTVSIVDSFAKTSNLNICIADAGAFQGINYARNVGIAHASAPYVMICDADDVVGVNWLQFGLKNFEVYKIWSGSAIPVPDTDFPEDFESARALFDLPKQDWAPPVLEQSGTFQVLMGGNFGADKNYLAELGGFDVSAPSPGDDNELAMRVLRHGDPIPVSKHVLIGYRSRTNADFINRSYFLGAKSHAWLATQYGVVRESPYGNPVINLMKTHLYLPFKYVLCRGSIEWKDVVHRQKSARGFSLGLVQYKMLKREKHRQIGVGWLA
ncbi:glycosyltransferase [Rothia terrae]|uniref:glycosyltransferase n=1 Tax=Rothia terrae TaxID=396015 RepID=UPI0033FA38D9